MDVIALKTNGFFSHLVGINLDHRTALNIWIASLNELEVPGSGDVPDHLCCARTSQQATIANQSTEMNGSGLISA